MNNQKKPLSKEPRRTDLTDRECCSIIGGVIGGLASCADIESVRNAVRWWAETDEAWMQMKSAKAIAGAVVGNTEAEGVAN